MQPNNPHRQIVHQGRKIRVALETATGADGQPFQRDVILHPGAVAILPFLDDGRVCLVRNNRPVVGETLLEIPAGTLEPDEPPDTAAVRELEEETGYRAAHWQKVTEFFPSPGVISERTHLYVAKELTPGSQQLEIDEDLEPVLFPWDDVLQMAFDGTIRDAKTLVAVLLWERLKA